jgi:DNA repair exonuclease SbcCD ATPase subunit
MATPIQPGLVTSIEPPTQITDNTNGAQSPVPSSVAFQHGATGERVFTEAEMAKARKDEKDKLYGEITSLRDQFAQAQKTLQDIQGQKAQEIAEAERIKQEKEAQAQAKREDEMSAKALLEAKLKETNDTWEDRFTKLQQERDQERALAAKEREYNELVDYRNSQLQANVNDIAPQFHNFINGDTREQIDNAIAQAKSATESIYQQVAEARQQQAPSARGVSATGYTALGPLDGTMGKKQYTPEDINAMSMAEYAKFRQESGLAGNDAARSRGLFG